MAHWLGVSTAPEHDLSWFPEPMLVGSQMPAKPSALGGPELWPPAGGTCTHVHIQVHIIEESNKNPSLNRCFHTGDALSSSTNNKLLFHSIL